MDHRSFYDTQRDYWQRADEAHFRWQTDGAYVGRSEAALLSEVEIEAGDRLLEIGCGEGGNLAHLTQLAELAHPKDRKARLFGVDFSLEKARFAATATGAFTACADAEHLPFGDGAFDAVLIRDLLHHVPDRHATLKEALRVLRPGGRLTVIEPNGRNPLIALQALAKREERQLLVSTRDRLVGELLRVGFRDVRCGRAQPLPVSRLVFHHAMGLPALGRSAVAGFAIGALERGFGVLPRGLWAYLIAHGQKHGPARP